MIYIKKEDETELRKYLKEGRFGQMKGNDKFAMLEECEKLYREKDYNGAIDVCNEILKTDLNNQSALGYKARCLYLLDEYDEALKLLNNALILYPQNYHYLYTKAEVLMDKEEYGKAIECFEKILEIEVVDETALAFIKMYYETCIRLRIDQLIEREKYVSAWKCYNRLSKIKSSDLSRSQMIDRFRRYVRGYTSKLKNRRYYVRISSDKAKTALIRFLKENGFENGNDSGKMLLIDVIDRTYNAVSVDEIGYNHIISESKFLDKVNYYPRNMIERKKIFTQDNELLYEGYVIDDKAYGFGTVYFANGNIYREGIFDLKGIVQGREYYPSGQLRFEGTWRLTTGYGPNAPGEGNAYDDKGNLIFSGKFEIKRGGVGWPMIQNPKGFACEQKERPKMEYFNSLRLGDRII